MTVSKSKRFSVFARDSFTCQFCGKKPPAVVLEVDHFHPASQGGSDDESNLITACFDCNRGKSDTVVESDPRASSESIEIRREMLEQMREMAILEAQLRELEDDNNRHLARYWFSLMGDANRSLSPRLCTTVRVFQRSLLVDEIRDSMEIAHSRVPVYEDGKYFETWRYFCGICWKRIRAKRGEQ